MKFLNHEVKYDEFYENISRLMSWAVDHDDWRLSGFEWRDREHLSDCCRPYLQVTLNRMNRIVEEDDFIRGNEYQVCVFDSAGYWQIRREYGNKTVVYDVKTNGLRPIKTLLDQLL